MIFFPASKLRKSAFRRTKILATITSTLRIRLPGFIFSPSSFWLFRASVGGRSSFTRSGNGSFSSMEGRKHFETKICSLHIFLFFYFQEMEGLVESGKVKSIGLSNFNAAQVKKIVSNSKIQPANLQVELHAFLQQPELVDTCKKLNVSVTAYAPLGSPHAKNHFKDKYDFE